MICISCGASTKSFSEIDDIDQQHKLAFVAWESGRYDPTADQIAYARRVLPQICQEADEYLKIKRLTDFCSVDTFVTLPDNIKRQWFSYAVKLRARVRELENENAELRRTIKGDSETERGIGV